MVGGRPDARPTTLGRTPALRHTGDKSVPVPSSFTLAHAVKADSVHSIGDATVSLAEVKRAW
jgi:hypothetical protein